MHFTFRSLFFFPSLLMLLLLAAAFSGMLATRTVAVWPHSLSNKSSLKMLNAELKDSGPFTMMDLHNEEAEHSIEMQLPYIAKIMEKYKQPANRYSIVPVLVGSLSSARQTTYGKIFSKYLSDPRTVFVISSDFCHWGNRFHFMPYDSTAGVPIYEQIAALDKEGMDAISSLDPAIFTDYLKKTQNTICGRNPIGVILCAAEYFRQMNNHSTEFVFLKYAQSNQVSLQIFFLN
ncbi:unnamed protein product [Gongylonema pulchrum]|uniref:Protein MEMO1 n=1 Tax=Gongylonema pulchrum TaxID=637853 RepID=A0A183E6F9_9BILA|nr:unnamed protein product [Gongylonema pulchrum]